MLFNSLIFAIFLPLVFILYWIIPTKKFRLQNLVLLAASWVFYGWWDWRFLGLLIFSAMVDYVVGLLMYPQTNIMKRKALMGVSLVLNLGLLAFFKYFNFFADSLQAAFATLGIALDMPTLKVVLPVGISFYTFQSLSYGLHIYRKKLEPTKDVISFLSFISFFPQLVAGPIERASNLLPQFLKSRSFKMEEAKDGLRQILWGLFKKMVLADNCAEVANRMFNYGDYNELGAINLMFGAIFFAFQIYGDFSGYSDIALGTSKLFGFTLMRNFNFPYFSRNIAEFWRRWHISLTTWFRDYVYIPMGGNRVKTKRVLFNTIVVFLVSGFWHGANWTFIFWGMFHALLFIPLILSNSNHKFQDTVAEGRLLPSIREILQMLFTFLLVTLGWIFFRAQDIQHAFAFISAMMHHPIKNGGALLLWILSPQMLYISVVIIFEWIQRNKQHALENMNLDTKWRWILYSGLILMIIFTKQMAPQQFIYFQF